MLLKSVELRLLSRSEDTGAGRPVMTSSRVMNLSHSLLVGVPPAYASEVLRWLLPPVRERSLYFAPSMVTSLPKIQPALFRSFHVTLTRMTRSQMSSVLSPSLIFTHWSFFASSEGVLPKL